jgi:HlyD family secretion protein
MTVRRWLLGVAAIAVVILAYLNWRSSRPEDLPAGFVRSNGRIEAVEIDVATKTAGRIEAILVDEGDFVTAGQVVARMDTDVLEAQLREAEAQLRQARSAVDAAKSNVTQREREKAAAEAVVAQREAEFEAEGKDLARTQRLFERGAETREELDIVRSTFLSSKAMVAAAKANAAAADSAITTAQLQVVDAEAAVDAANARIERLKADIEDSALKAPRDGRVQYRVAQPGEVMGAGGKVLNLVDLADVYMTFFLPTAAAGRVEIGTEVRLVLDAAPQYVVPARVSFVADVAQFTPKTVETAEERQKLTFRVKARIDPELLKAHIRKVKTGLPGMAYVRLDPNAEWPPHLSRKAP